MESSNLIWQALSFGREIGFLIRQRIEFCCEDEIRFH